MFGLNSLKLQNLASQIYLSFEWGKSAVGTDKGNLGCDPHQSACIQQKAKIEL
jgi:hypothetical protein